jgi:cell wall assembly regulator SMI1
MFGLGKKPFDPARFDAGWNRYLAAIETGHPAFRTYFAAGASEGQIAAAETELKQRLSPDLRHLLLRNAGSVDERQVLPGWSLFLPERIVDEWRIWEELRRDQFLPEGYDCAPEGPIKGDEWWRLGWVPFCGDGGGNHLCVDLDPPPKGRPGQVISMWHDDPARALIAGSITEYIEIIATDAENRLLSWSEEWGGVYAPVED